MEPAQHRRPRTAQDEVTAAAGPDLVPLLVVDSCVDARERLGRRPWLQRGHSGQRCDHDHSGLGLPPRVDDRCPVAADVLPVPDPGLRVDRFSDRTEQPQRRQIVLLGVFRPPFHVRSDRRRCRVEDVDLVALDDRPPTILVRVVRDALVDHAGRAVAQRPVHDVAVAGDPADVGRAPVHRAGLDVEDVVVRRRGADEVAARCVNDPLRLRGRAARVEQVEQVLRVHRLARTCGRLAELAVCELVQPDVPALHHRGAFARTAVNDRVPYRRRLVERLVGVLLEGHLGAVSPALVLGDQELAPHVVHPVGQRLGRKAAEDDRVRGTQACAGEHRDRQLRDHPHVDRDRSAFLHAEPPEPVREANDLVLEVGEGQLAAVVLRLTFPVVGNLGAVPGLDVPVNAVEADIQLAAEVPPGVRRLPFVELAERLEPRDALAAFGFPELLEVAVVDLGLRVRLSREVIRRGIPALLEQDRLDRGPLAAHGSLGLEIVRIVRQDLGAVLRDEHEIFEPAAAVTVAIETRLQGDHVARDELAGVTA